MLDFDSFMLQVESGLVSALERTASHIVVLAKNRAPVRHVFGGGTRPAVRLKSISEVMADRGLRAAMGLGPEHTFQRGSRVRPATVAVHLDPANHPFVASERHGVAPFLAGMPGGHLRDSSAEERLDRRGRYELGSGRANRRGYLGGRLRGEIFATPPAVEGSLISAQIISPTPYAKYQEFGTRHNAAHPFLRPALQEGTPAFIANVARAIDEAVKSGIPAGGEIVVKVMLKAQR